MRSSSIPCSRRSAGEKRVHGGRRAHASDTVAWLLAYSALLESDVNVKLVANLRSRVKAKVLPQLQASQNVAGQTGITNTQKQLLQKTVYDELVALVDPGQDAQPSFQPKKGKTQIIMAVGLQGAGKTTSCTKVRACAASIASGRS